MRNDTYNGILVRAVLLSTGAELARNLFSFDEHRTVPSRYYVQTLGDLQRMHEQQELAPGPLREAVARYLSVFTDPPAGPSPRHHVAPTTARTEAARAATTASAATSSTAPAGAPPASTSATPRTPNRPLASATRAARRPADSR
ncbi:hypothetical protein ACFV6F_35025 [Kitasatospora phosalacinea]|uniref:hypothetical protein n=1 Tax=Kitasatospora phosalacinea TaxID=2065 RepID=UPI00365CA353